MAIMAFDDLARIRDLYGGSRRGQIIALAAIHHLILAERADAERRAELLAEAGITASAYHQFVRRLHNARLLGYSVGEALSIIADFPSILDVAIDTLFLRNGKTAIRYEVLPNLGPQLAPDLHERFLSGEISAAQLAITIARRLADDGIAQARSGIPRRLIIEGLRADSGKHELTVTVAEGNPNLLHYELIYYQGDPPSAYREVGTIQLEGAGPLARDLIAKRLRARKPLARAGTTTFDNL